jgi:hypothetical protein
MARPTKQGIDYFPLDVYLDNKFKFLEIKFGLEGFAIIIKIFQKIYANGYWCNFNEDEQLLFSYDINVDINRIRAIINEAITRDIFDKNLFDTYQILTSKGIQKRYKEIVKRRKDVEIVPEYLLINGDFGVSRVFNECKSSQSKVKESKVKETKAKERKVKESKVDKTSYLSISKQIEEFTEDKELKEVLKEFVEMREKNKKKLTNYAFYLILRKLSRLSANTNTQIEILNQSIQNSWQDVYALKTDFSNKKEKLPDWYGSYEKQLENLPKEEEKEMTQEEIDKILKEAKETLVRKEIGE